MVLDAVSRLSAVAVFAIVAAIPCVLQAAPRHWYPVSWADGQDTPIDQFLLVSGYSCPARTYDEIDQLGVAVCTSPAAPDLSIYEIDGRAPVLNLKLMRGLGDAYSARIYEFHSPFMVNREVSRSNVNASQKASHVVYLIDVSDESNCYGTEVLELKNSRLAYAGSIVESAHSISKSFGIAGYSMSSACLGRSGQVQGAASEIRIVFHSAEIERPDSLTGELKRTGLNSLVYRLSRSKLTRVGD